jgi:hypothetical protein
MSAGASGCWLGYGLLHDAPVVWLASVPGVLGALVVLQALAVRRRSDVLPAPAALPAAPVQLPQPRREPVLAA